MQGVWGLPSAVATGSHKGHGEGFSALEPLTGYGVGIGADSSGEAAVVECDGEIQRASVEADGGERHGGSAVVDQVGRSAKPLIVVRDFNDDAMGQFFTLDGSLPGAGKRLGSHHRGRTHERCDDP